MNVGVVVFPGSNCDRDMFHVLSDVFNLNAQYCWHDKPLPENLDAVVLPGGFSYGDRPSCQRKPIELTPSHLQELFPSAA